MSWELETRFQLIGEEPFERIEESFAEAFGAELVSDKYCTDKYKKFLPPIQWYRERFHNGTQPYSQKKMHHPAPDNPYGITLSIEIPVKYIEENQSNRHLEIAGHRRTYELMVGKNKLHIPFDRMTNPEGNFIEVGIERTGFPLDGRLKQLTDELVDFIGGKFLPLFDGKTELKVRPIYPLIVLESSRHD